MYWNQLCGFYSLACLQEPANPYPQDFEGLATRGKCSMGWFFGFKLHLTVNDNNFMFTAADVDDREPLKQGSFLSNIKGKLCADKGYIDKTLFETLFLNGIQLIPKSRTT